ncbi:hypothetical protein CGCS363_v007305 [Colletotrichum siamense]|uniref:uncharacterized protein n=1 Tax=Colletotrichum siamense TaxID=690259 RepID=UPI001872F610|nr:uncharacterized protein CGCS363_v007305 [Colletotrichum siamense]KAF5501373.1 hypothetical protein CGCS363_v007305 [Colletotrichum siamense]
MGKKVPQSNVKRLFRICSCPSRATIIDNSLREVSNPLCPRGPSSNKNTSLTPPQANAQPTYTCSPQPPHQHSQLSNPPPYQYSHQNPPQPVQEDKSSRAGIIGATTGGLTAHLLGGGILSTMRGAMAGAAEAKEISEYAQALFPDLDQ